MTSSRRVTVSTGARLHFGLLAHRPQSGREFGGLGVMVNSSGWSITVSHSDFTTDQVIVEDSANADCPETEDRVTDIVNRLRQRKGFDIPALQIEVTRAIPSHRGLGSGTQLALAMARAINIYLSMDSLPASELAELTGRGLRSAVGTWGFDSGGLIADGGKLPSDTVGTLVARMNFPSNWRFLLVYPRHISGLSGEQEVAAFGNLPGMPQETTDTLCRLALMELLPAVRERQFERASDALYQYGRQVGEYFAPAQDGIFVDARMHEFNSLLAENGIRGFAQTSWGPTCAILCSSDDMALRATEIIQSTSEADDYECVISTPLNHGATVEVNDVPEE